TDGKNPYAGVLQTVENGPIYTVTTEGGSANLGALVSNASGCTINVLHNFAGGSDGATPYGSLLYANNAIYGTTANGGTGTNLGTVFRINPDGSGYSILHVFQGICCGNADGSFPRSGLTLNRKNGLLYGTTINGGNSSDDGTVFSIDPNTGTETVVHAFSGSDGAHPYGNLYIKGRTLYGTTAAGGANNLGTVFRLKT
ncbi:MAG TPA: choice-of-anchor tandem repeat GloVer-containing protein, partial [Rhizomicrobium sp.]|nr:choice-of-anchor tandem repeat GloVer-containing protein [Rhizomicrobium sp.]